MSVKQYSSENLLLINKLIEVFLNRSDLSTILRILREDIRLYTDDGPGPLTPPRLLFGIGQCSKFLEAVNRSIKGPHYWKLCYLQGRPAALFFRPHQKTPHALLIIEKQGEKIRKIQFLRHPDRIYNRLAGMSLEV